MAMLRCFSHKARTSFWRMWSIALTAMAVAACSQPEVPQDQFYRLTARGPAATYQQAPIAGTVSVDPFRADGLVSQRPVVYSARNMNFVLNQYHYHYWVESPPNMFQAQLADYLARARVAQAVASEEARDTAGCRIGGEIRRFERVVGEGPSVVVIEAAVRIFANRGHGQLWNRVYTVELQAGDERMESVIFAFNFALGDLFDRLGADLAQNPISCPSPTTR